MRWGWEKKTERECKKKIPVWLLSHSHFYDMEADCFPVSKNTESKPDLPLVGRVHNLMGQRKKKQGRVQWGRVTWIYASDIPRSSEKSGWSKGWGIKRIGMGKILETNNLVTGTMTHNILFGDYCLFYLFIYSFNFNFLWAVQLRYNWLVLRHIKPCWDI